MRPRAAVQVAVITAKTGDMSYFAAARHAGRIYKNVAMAKIHDKIVSFQNRLYSAYKYYSVFNLNCEIADNRFHIFSLCIREFFQSYRAALPRAPDCRA